VRRLSIRLKLAAALAAPMVGLIGATLLEVSSTSGQARDVREQTELALAVTGPTGLLTALQNERALPAAELVGLTDALDLPVRSYQQAWDETDAAIETFEADLASKPQLVRDTYAEALAGLAEIRDIRADIDANAEPRDLRNRVFSELIFARYSDLVTPFYVATTRIVAGVTDGGLRQGAVLVDTTVRQIEVLAQLLNALISDAAYFDGIAASIEIADLSAMTAEARENVTRLQQATGPYRTTVEEHLPVAIVDQVSVAVEATIGAGPVEDVTPLAAAFTPPSGGGYAELRDALGETIQRRADDLNAAAEARQRWYSGLALATMSVAAALVLVVSRSITRPLRSLTVQATAMARRDLPEAVRSILNTPPGQDVLMPEAAPLRVTARDEVADVAHALNVVLHTALQLAAEQAVLRRNIADSFVNLGRRNQNLLGRQIDFITQLEAQEVDADVLANLFMLDHLATRMRRNAESLLVLAGVEPPRQWAAPVPVADIVRAALSEVEDYHRVVVRDIHPASVLGSAATDLAHLLAELIENGLAFSPPDRPVEMWGAALPGARYAVAVVDTGPGLPPQAIKDANRRLAGDEQFAAAPSRYMGHYVAGQLAARHNIEVRLGPTPGTGITATATVPPSVVEVSYDELDHAPVGEQASITGPLTRRARAPGHAHAPAPQTR
jgi:signal transduction histidine kinase